MVSSNWRWFYGSGEEEVKDARPQGAPRRGRHESFETGCGKPIKWETMIPLTIEELRRHELLPQGVQYEVTPPERAGTGLTMQQKLQRMVDEMGIDASGPVTAQVKELFSQMGMDVAQQPPNLAEQVDILYNVIIDVPSS